MKKNTVLKNKYKAERIEVKLIINLWDPMGLLAMGAPDNEYDIEVSDILVLLQKKKDVNDMAICIQSIFEKWFSETLPEQECREVAEKLLNRK